ncbi:hypothetical protein [Brevibacterium atlanticum]|uniref:hypothetical protein n=1 Tax=Brevibacterium atlanticum TaxID=2697563 RepID=UPI00141D86AA|nr:hypothetical protein [Brevibacterium atlanticum]
MDLFQRRNRRPPWVSCLIVAFVAVSVTTTVLITAVVVILVVADTASSGDEGSTPGVSTTAPVEGGWSGEG